MSLELRWVGEADLDRVARARMLCYSHAGRDLERIRSALRDNPRPKPGDFLLAERDGEAVGTATSLSMTMWVRGGPVRCQGVAWVGTVKTHRRRTKGADGIATQIMRETLRLARDREQVVSALMPFRASFYEHFGYGLVERRREWTVPLTVLPHGDFEGIEFYRERDLPELVSYRQRIVEQSQCDIERPEDAWRHWLKAYGESGFVVVDRSAGAGIHGYLSFEHQQAGTKDVLRVLQMSYEDVPALRRQLHFLASLRDQYHSAVMILPAALQLNRLLRETQLPHRPVNHAHAEARMDTRMQVRVLHHKRFLEAMKLPARHRGSVIVAVRESEGHESRFAIDLSDGRASVSVTNASAEFICPDQVWAAVACGDLPATEAVRLDLASEEEAGAARVLDAFSDGPPPFSHEYF
jgi:predicted acetyltransferase